MMVRAIVMRTAALAALWWVLTGGTQAAWASGAVIVTIAVAISVALLPPGTRRVSLRKLPSFLAFFLVQSIKGSVQVAAMTMRPRLNLHPAMLEIRLRLPEDSSRLFLASILNLLPGTLSAGLTGDRLLLHVLDQRWPVEQMVRDAEEQITHLLGMQPR